MVIYILITITDSIIYCFDEVAVQWLLDEFCFEVQEDNVLKMLPIPITKTMLNVLLWLLCYIGTIWLQSINFCCLWIVSQC